MYYICKYVDCWAVHDSLTGGSRKLRLDEIASLRVEYESLMEEKVITLSVDKIRSLLPVFKNQYIEGQINAANLSKSLIDLHG
jgi:hypothetical protein